MLLEARRAAGLTQVELSRRSGVPRTAISMYESGRREPGADVFLRLLTATGAALDQGRPTGEVDCYRNSQIFTSLTSILGSVPIKESEELGFPTEVWKLRG